MEDQVMEMKKVGEVYITPIKPMDQSRPLDAVRAETIQAVFDWIKNHTDIKDESGNVIPDAYIDARDIKLSDYLREHGI